MLAHKLPRGYPHPYSSTPSYLVGCLALVSGLWHSLEMGNAGSKSDPQSPLGYLLQNLSKLGLSQCPQTPGFLLLFLLVCRQVKQSELPYIQGFWVLQSHPSLCNWFSMAQVLLARMALPPDLLSGDLDPEPPVMTELPESLAPLYQILPTPPTLLHAPLSGHPSSLYRPSLFPPPGQRSKANLLSLSHPPLFLSLLLLPCLLLYSPPLLQCHKLCPGPHQHTGLLSESSSVASNTALCCPLGEVAGTEGTVESMKQQSWLHISFLSHHQILKTKKG